jgi:hypothetical protein
MPVMSWPTIGVCEIRRIIEECYEQALATLRGSRDRLNRLAHTLLDRETWEKRRRTLRWHQPRYHPGRDCER